MKGRERRLRALADRLCRREEVRDAWTAKSFTDRLFLIETESGRELSEAVRATLRERGLRGYNAVHGLGGEPAFAGALDRGDRYKFVDVRERGQLQSYVVE